MELNYDIKIYRGVSHMEYQICSHVAVFSVLEGKAILKFEEEKIELRKGEIYVVNFGKLFKVYTPSSAVLAELEVDYVDLLKSSDKKNLKFYCDTSNDISKSHYQLKKFFSKLLYLHVIGGKQFEEWSFFYRFISILITQYTRYSTNDLNHLEDDKINQVCIYLHTHYKEKISLEDICNQFYFSTSTLTRNFKKQTNKSIIQYLNEIRIQSAKQLLLEKKNSVTDVALEVGFSDAATFIKTFKKIIGISPLKFRQKILMGDNYHEIENDELVKMVEETFLIEYDNSLLDDESKIYRKNDINTYHVIPYDKVWTQAIGIQKAAVLLDSRYQQKLLHMHKLMRFQYIRIPFILSKEMIDGKDNHYNFNKIDLILDFLIENQIIPFIELSGRHMRVVLHEVDLAVEEINEYDYSDKELKKIMIAFMNHIFYRYGGIYGRLSEWIWEFQYDRTSSHLDKYLSKFKYMSDEVHKWGRDYQIGGYGIDIYDWNDKELASLAKQSFQPDFFSVNVYPYRCRLKKGNIKYLERIMDPVYLQNEMKKLNEAVKMYNYSHIPIYVTQWNTTLEDCNVMNDSYIKSSMVMTFVDYLTKMAQLFIYDTASDIKPIESKVDNELYGGKGLISQRGLEKSVFGTMVGLASLGTQILYFGHHLIFSYLKPGHLIGICYNRKNFNMSYYQKSEYSIKEEDINNVFDDQDILEQQISISYLLNGIYRIRLKFINEGSSILTRLKKINNQVYLDGEDIQFLKGQRYFDVQLKERIVINNHLELKVSVKPNEIVIIEVFPIQLDD